MQEPQRGHGHSGDVTSFREGQGNKGDTWLLPPASPPALSQTQPETHWQGSPGNAALGSVPRRQNKSRKEMYLRDTGPGLARIT